MPAAQDLHERTCRYLHARRFPSPALRVAVEIPLGPVLEFSAGKDRHGVRRHVLHEPVPLRLRGDHAPGRTVGTRQIPRLFSPTDRTEQHQPVDQLRTLPCQQPDDRAPPRMRDQADALAPGPLDDETHGNPQLPDHVGRQ